MENGKSQWPVMPTLFHELGHNTDTNHREGVETKEVLQKASLGLGRFYEWTNTVFENLVTGKKFYKKDDAMELTRSGYGALAPLGSMISSALGISEIEFAKIKDKGRAYEEEYMEKIFPGEGSHILERAKKIFDKYQLETDFSLSKKKDNQELLNELYQECIEIMKKRIDIQRSSITDIEAFKKYQSFFLKKINTNFRAASKSDGLRFLKVETIHDIGFCTDSLSKSNLADISREFVSRADLGFDNNSLDKYSQAIKISDKRTFDQKIRVPFIKIFKSQKSGNSKNNTRETTDKEQTYYE